MTDNQFRFKSSIVQTRNMHENSGLNHPITQPEPTSINSNFYFQQRRGSIDLKSLIQINVDDIIRSTDINTLQMHLENLTFSELNENDLRFLTDPQIIKLFRTSQLMVEYLLYAQDQLASNLNQLADKYIVKKRYVSIHMNISMFVYICYST